MGRPSDARERLIAAARDVIYARSYEAVTVDDLCAAARVNKSSFYHFFSSKQDLVLTALDSVWQWFENVLMRPAFAPEVPPHERVVRFFDLMAEKQQVQKETGGHMRGCPLGNLSLEMSTQDELLRLRVEHFFGEWLAYCERALREAKEAGTVPTDLDVKVTAQALLAYFEGAVLLAKGRNDPSLLDTLRGGIFSLMRCIERHEPRGYPADCTSPANADGPPL